MMKKIALCAVLILILIPAFAMAAGPQGPGSSKSTTAGNGPQLQQQTTSEITSQVQLRSCQQQGFGIAAENGNGQMIRNRICEQDREMLQNMIRNQTRTSPASGTAAISQDDVGPMIQAQNRVLEQKRIQAGLTSGYGMVSLSGSADQLRDRVQDMIRNQTRLQDGSCGNCPGR
jgi:hypothetical protein